MNQPANRQGTLIGRIAPTLHGYQRAWIGSDLLAGLTLAAIALPEQMATAKLAGMPAIAGLYAFLAGSLVFALLGRHPQMSIGADSTIAPIFAAGVAAMVAVGDPHYAQLVSFLALMVGALLIAIGLLRMGWISDFLSTPVITGVLAGIAIEIMVRQIPTVFGLPGGGESTVDRLRTSFDQRGDINGWSVVLAAAVLALVLIGERIDRRLPGALIGVVTATIVVGAFSLGSHGVETLGSIHAGLPSFGITVPSAADIGRLAATALIVAFVCVAQTAATARATGGGAIVRNFDDDLVAVGVGSVVAGFAGSFAVDSSPPRTTVVATSGGRSQLSGVVASAIIVVAIVASRLLENLPQAALGGILVFVATRLFRVKQMVEVLRFDIVEFLLMLTATAAVALLGIEQGVLVAIVLSLGYRTWRSARPRDTLLGRLPGTDSWIPPDVGPPTEQVPGVVVYLCYAPLWYGNAEYVRGRILQQVAAAPAPVTGVVIDANAMSDIDFTGTQALGDLAKDLKKRGIAIAIARSSHIVHHDLKHSGLLAEFGPDRLYPTVAAAVGALASRPAASP